MIHRAQREIAGRMLSIEVGRMGKQANGAAVVRYADTAVFAAVTAADVAEGLDFFPLFVDYREKTYAAGKFPGGFIKREGRPTTKETLTMRLMDRPLRPLFPEGFLKEVAVASFVLSADRENDPDILAMIASASAVAVSDVPFLGPAGSVRIGLSPGGDLLVMPTHQQLEEGRLDLVLSATRSGVTMVECGAKEVPEETIIQAISLGYRVAVEIIELQEELMRVLGKPKMEIPPELPLDDLYGELKGKAYEELKAAILAEGKFNRRDAMDAVVERIRGEYCPEGVTEPVHDPAIIKKLMERMKKDAERDLILSGVRADRRSASDVREIQCEVGILPRTHGSALFTRGETQALAVVTLGTALDEQIVDGLKEEYSEKFMLHYNFPSFSVGETWPNRGPRRREIGHGALAGRALQPVIPGSEEFPYTIRVVSDIMESNGSSSMATVCGGTLALMDAGVKISRPVAGIAMGMVREGDVVRILSDILGSEDHNGDMDFKVAGTEAGITALQMDIKVTDVSEGLMRAALEQARVGRVHILQEMLRVLPEPRAHRSPYAPVIVQLKIDPERIGVVIGPGGKTIKRIQMETDSTVDIEDDGRVTIWGQNEDAARAAKERVEALTEEVKPGRRYNGKVVSIKDFGCFVEVLPGQEGLVHVSELDPGYVERPSDVVKIGDYIPVKCVGVDPQGRIRLSRKAALAE